MENNERFDYDAAIAELEKMQSEAPAPTPTIEERVASVEEDTKVIRAILMGEHTSE